MQSNNAQKITDLHNRLVERIANLESLWRDARSYCESEQNSVTDDKSNFLVNTSIGRRATSDLANGLHANTYSVSRPWFAISPDDSDEVSEVTREWAAQASEKVHNELNARFSKAYLRALALSCVTGNAVTYTGMVDGEMYHRTYRVGRDSVVYAMDQYDRPDMFSRKFKLTIREAAQQFSASGDTPPKAWGEKLAKDPTCQDNVDIIHCVKRRTKGEYKKGSPLAKDQLWAGYYVCCDNESKVIRETGYRTCPYAVLRWDRAEDEFGGMGIGPGVHALPDFRQLNGIEHSITYGIDMQVQPPIFYPDGVEPEEWDMKPGGANVYDAMNGKAPTEYRTSINLADASAKAYEFKEIIREHFYNDVLFALMNDQRRKTATEVNEISDEKLQAFGSIIQNVEEYHSAVIVRVVDLLEAEQKLSTPPEEIFDPSITRIQFNSRMRSRLEIYQARQSVAVIGDMAQIADMVTNIPTIGDYIKMDKVFFKLMEAANIDPDIRCSEMEVEQAKKARMEAKQREQQMAMAAQVLGQIDPQKAPEAGSLAAGGGAPAGGIPANAPR